MKYILVILLVLIVDPSDSIKVDTCKTKLKKIQTQQVEINQKLDSLFHELNIDSLRKK